MSYVEVDWFTAGIVITLLVIILSWIIQTLFYVTEEDKSKVQFQDVHSGLHADESSSLPEEEIPFYTSNNNISTNSLPTVSSIAAKPNWISLRGKVARTNKFHTYNKVYENISNLFENPVFRKSVYELLELQFEHDRKANSDMALLSLLEGYNAAGRLSNDYRSSVKRYKKITTEIPSYGLKHPHIASAILFYNMFKFYFIAAKKTGKAFSALTAARFCIENHTPSTWTAVIYGIQADMYDTLAQLCHKNHQKYQDIAIKSFERALEHYFSQANEGGTNYLFYPLFYMINIAFIRLDMPTLDTMGNFSESNLIYKRLCSSTISEIQIQETERLLKYIEDNISSLKYGHGILIQERVLLARVFTNVHKSRSAIKADEFDKAMVYISSAYNAYGDWNNKCKPAQDTRFQTVIKYLPDDIKKVLGDIHQLIKVKLHGLDRLQASTSAFNSPTSSESLSSDDSSMQVKNLCVNSMENLHKFSTSQTVIGIAGQTERRNGSNLQMLGSSAEESDNDDSSMSSDLL